MRITSLIVFAAFYCIIFQLKAQSNAFNKAFDLFLTNQHHDAAEALNSPSNLDEELLLWHIESEIYGVKDSIVNNNYSDDSLIKGLQLIKNTEIYNYHYKEKDSISFNNIKEALELAKASDNKYFKKYSYFKFFEKIFANRELFDLMITYCNQFEPLIENPSDFARYAYYKFTTHAYMRGVPTIDSQQQALKRLKDSEDFYSKGVLNQIIGIQFARFEASNDSAFNYFEQAIQFYKQDTTFKSKSNLFKINNNIGGLYLRNDEYRKAIPYFLKTSQIDISNTDLLGQSYNYQALSDAYSKLKMYDSAYYYADLEKKTLVAFNEYDNAIKRREIESKYQTAEKERQILVEKGKKERNATIALGLAGIVIFGGISFTLIQKNTKRKQLLAEQEKELQLQKVDGLMKKMELKAIDAMIEGQEKERQQMASDLHNNIGNIMTTLQLQFSALEENPTKELFSKTSNLIKETYNKVRSLSHEKNASIFASQGLLKSLNNLASVINETKKLQIDIHEHNMDEPLPNSLELTIFRIIQELITNILKHAKANEVYVHLTNHGDNLNVVVEDDGVGFDPKKIKKSSGMGFYSMYKSIENLGGTITIDSSENNGTSVLIDIPL